MGYGVITEYIYKSPVIEWVLSVRKDPRIFFAGQITGVEGYVESASSGIVAGINMGMYLKDQSPIDFTPMTVIGALAHYISDNSIKNFQPMNSNYGIIVPLGRSIKNRQQRNM